MNGRDGLQLILYFLALAVVTPALGAWMMRVHHHHAPAGRSLGQLEQALYRLAGCCPSRGMSWRGYAAALLAFHGAGLVCLLALQSVQARLPLNPEALPNVPFPLALNTAVSFVTNTNWQAYSGEATMSYLTQAAGLAVQNFVSAATGIGVLLALARGLARRGGDAGLGNFWVDLVRSVLYVLLPLSLLLALVLVSQGVVQTFSPYPAAVGLEGGSFRIPVGPAASQIAIKQLGTNGGGFFGANSAHPFENPTPLSNFLQCLAILALPAGCVDLFGRMVGSRRHGLALLATMSLLFAVTLAPALWAESQANPALGGLPFLEGKETRFGIVNSILWAGATTAASNGSVNAMHDSLSPLGGLSALVNLLLGEVVFGGVGAGLYGMILFVILAVFLAGLMVGRTPEYLGKKVERTEVTWAMVAILAPSAVVLLCAAVACRTPAGLASLNNQGPHGLSEILYAFASMAGNNGSAFAGLNANTRFYNYLGSVALLAGRFLVILPVLAIAGSMAVKKVTPPSSGTFPTDGPLFVVLLAAVVLFVGGLTYLPALTLGPIAEHLLLTHGRHF